ncbi:MAG TPA: glycosyltransferase [Burkholderiales bacterium]|nr:glycosyltransferase [Burkholderiales bacterium]
MASSWLYRVMRRVMRSFSAPSVAAADARSPYERFRIDHLARRQGRYSCAQQPGLLSFVTTVWNTDVAYLRVLARSVLEQRGGTAFEWVVLDNGSTSAATIEYLAELDRHPCVRLHHTPANLGIIGGMRYCLERATGRYIVPLDSDDWLYPDCVEILTWHIVRHGYPALAYTDEDKLAGETYLDPYFKPDWDPVLFADSVYIAHLCAIDRERALALGVYSDRATEGSHDGDTFMRFHLAGHEPLHVPEVVYSWRMHPQSTASNMDSKSYIHESQKAVLARLLAAHPLGSDYTVEPSPFFAGTPDWWIRRRTAPPPVATVVLSDEGGDDPAACASECEGPRLVLRTSAPLASAAAFAQDMAQRDGLVRVAWCEVRPERDDAVACAAAVMELFPDTVIVGGPVHGQDGAALAAGCYFGFGRGCDSPDRGRGMGDPGYFAQMWKQHSVSAVSSQHMVVDARFLASFIDRHAGIAATFPALGAWAGAYARRLGKRVVYTPFLRARCVEDWDLRVSDEERRDFVSRNYDLMPDTRFLSPRLGLTAETAYLPVTSEARETHLAAFARVASQPAERRAMP